MDGVDGKSAGIVSKSAPLNMPGQLPGTHTIKAVKMGYEPDGPRDETVYAGLETTVTLKIMVPRHHNKAAVDRLDNGLEHYNKGFADNYKRAVGEFQQALALEPHFSQAALYLGRAYHALFEEELAEKYFRRAIEIDPDYLEARASFAGMLLDTNNLDEAVANSTSWCSVTPQTQCPGICWRTCYAANRPMHRPLKRAKRQSNSLRITLKRTSGWPKACA